MYGPYINLSENLTMNIVLSMNLGIENHLDLINFNLIVPSARITGKTAFCKGTWEAL